MIGGIGASIAWRGWRHVAYIALAAALLLPGLGEPAAAKTFRNVPLPRPRPQLVDATPTASATPAPDAAADPDPAAATAPAAVAPRSPRSPPSRHPPTRASRREQQEALANIKRLLQRLPHHGRPVHPVRPEWRAVGGRLLHAPARQDPLPLPPAGQARRHRRRPDGRRPRQPHDDAGLYPLSKTPLRYLLADHVDLTSDKVVSDVREEPDLIAIVIVEKTAFVDGKLTLIFDRKTFELRQWIVTDAQGLNTSVAIYNVATGKQPDPGLFKITYLQGPNLNGR